MPLRAFRDPTASLGMAVALPVMMLPFLLGAAVLLAWLARRLWFRWDAMTARAAVGTAIGIAVLWLTVWSVQAIDRRLGHGGNDHPADVPAMLVELIVAVVAYRWLVPRVLRSAGLDEPLDAHGQPPGHVARAQTFCVVLGWAVWLTASDVARHIGFGPGKHGPGWPEAAAVVGPIVLGWATYKIVRRRLIPRPIPPVPARGFEVLPVTQSEPPVG